MSSIKYAIKENKRLTFTFYKYKESERLFIEKAIEDYLKSINSTSISNQISYCLHELASNACKANSKRIYFNESNLDIRVPEHYQKGISDFKHATIVHQHKYFELRKENGLYIKFQIKRDDERLYISIINNVPLTTEEKIRIDDKIEKSHKYATVIDAYSDLQDNTEGAGLGIYTMILMLKEIGLKENNLKIFSINDQTHATIEIKYR